MLDYNLVEFELAKEASWLIRYNGMRVLRLSQHVTFEYFSVVETYADNKHVNEVVELLLANREISCLPEKVIWENTLRTKEFYFKTLWNYRNIPIDFANMSLLEEEISSLKIQVNSLINEFESHYKKAPKTLLILKENLDHEVICNDMFELTILHEIIGSVLTYQDMLNYMKGEN